MRKDKEGKSHPEKGNPVAALSTQNDVKKTGKVDVASQDIADKYTVGEDEPAPHLHVRHRNRNLDKKESRVKGKVSQLKKEILKPETSKVQSEEIALPLTKEIFAEFANDQSSVCISVFLPTSPAADGKQQKNSSAFKSKLQQVAAQLKQKNLDDHSTAKMLQPGYDLLEHDSFWDTLSTGLAVFINEVSFRYIKMPVALKEELFINNSFYLSPLLPIIAKNDYFYLLVLSKKQAKLYRADAFGMAYVKIDEMPNGVDDVVHFEEKDDHKLSGIGSSGDKPDDKANVAAYFDEVDETLWKAILNREHVPLLLAGVEYLIPIYKSVAKYKPIAEENITGNHEHEDIHSLYSIARKKMESYFDERHVKALEAYGNHSVTELTSSILDDVVPAAHYKRVAHLFVGEGEHIWGSFDEMNNKLIVHDAQEEGDEDLVDKAVTKTILNGGEVHILPKERMPADSIIAALMRY